jgi:hypothetical protein
MEDKNLEIIKLKAEVYDANKEVNFMRQVIDRVFAILELEEDQKTVEGLITAITDLKKD